MIFEDDGSEFGLLKGHISRGNAQCMTSCQPWMRSPFSPAINITSRRIGIREKSSTARGADLELRRGTRLWPLKAIEDEQWLLTFLNRLTDVHEASSPFHGR